MMARDFRGILAWQKADDLAVEIYRATGRCFPREERYALTSQIRSAAVSVAANIAEGSGRRTLKDFRSFLYKAQGSLSEVEYYLHLARRLDYLDKDDYARLEAQRAEVGRLLAGFIAFLDRQIAQGHTV
ncbi:MAG TPA: four helix bundle protein [Chloroflexi bacterium]|nr:four helix bundle protein [Chloroflexota bacterium]